jgi:hypothetical protein
MPQKCTGVIATSCRAHQEPRTLEPVLIVKRAVRTLPGTVLPVSLGFSRGRGVAAPAAIVRSRPRAEVFRLIRRSAGAPPCFVPAWRLRVRLARPGHEQSGGQHQKTDSGRDKSRWDSGANKRQTDEFRHRNNRCIGPRICQRNNLTRCNGCPQQRRLCRGTYAALSSNHASP